MSRIKYCAHGEYSVVNCRICQAINYVEAGPINNKQHTPTPDRHYGIGKIDGTDTWTVGKNNSLTQVFHFHCLDDAINKLRELEGDEFIVRAVNSHDALLEAAKEILDAPDIKLCVKGRWSTADHDQYYRAEKLRRAIAQAEGQP